MLLTLLLMLVNSGMSFIANYLIHFSALDLAPISVMILAAKGYSVFWSALLMVSAYAIVSPKEFRFVWITIPMAMVAGYGYLAIPSTALVLAVYHAGGLLSSLIFGYLNPKYVGFVIVNFSVNYVVGKLYILLFL